MNLKPGSRWKSAVCDTEVVVVRPPKGDAVLECGGQPVNPLGEEVPAGLALSPDFSDGTQAGKRFVDAKTSLEVLCTKAGAGSLSIEGRKIGAVDAKKLPSSD